MAKVLLGFMGVGKSSVAPYLNGRFVDMDQVIEDKIGMSITDFFAKEGLSLIHISEPTRPY